MAQGRKTGGRQAGVPNKRTAATKAVLLEVVAKFEEAVPAAFDGDAVALMQVIYRDPQYPIELRLDAAKSSARFERPTLSAAMVKDVTPSRDAGSRETRIRELLERGLANGAVTIIGE
jgi:hypothetical protein